MGVLEYPDESDQLPILKATCPVHEDSLAVSAMTPKWLQHSNMCQRGKLWQGQGLQRAVIGQ